MADQNQLSRSQMTEASDVAEGLLEKILEGVPRTAMGDTERREGATGGAPKQRLFFPNGIELISVIVKFGGVDVEVKIAGSAAPDGASAAPVFSAPAIGTFIICCHSGIGLPDATLTWVNPQTFPITIYFPGVCPVNVNGFTVPAAAGLQMGTYPAQVIVNGGTYEYTCSRAMGTEADNEATGTQNPVGGGNPKVIIL